MDALSVFMGMVLGGMITLVVQMVMEAIFEPYPFLDDSEDD